MKRRHRGRKARKLTTAAGPVKLSRVYFECPVCRDSGYPLDDRLGVAGRYSREAERLACLAAASWSYDISSQRLQELCGLAVGATTIREIAQRHGAAANEWMRTEPEAAREFRQADGEAEFTTDGTCVNTTGGWREMKLGIFSKRDRGEPATPQEWESRTLPRPKVRMAFAAVRRARRQARHREERGVRPSLEGVAQTSGTAGRFGDQRAGRRGPRSRLLVKQDGSGKNNASICQEPTACWTSFMPGSICRI